jgi:hypothetical protein
VVNRRVRIDVPISRERLCPYPHPSAEILEAIRGMGLPVVQQLRRSTAGRPSESTRTSGGGSTSRTCPPTTKRGAMSSGRLPTAAVVRDDEQASSVLRHRDVQREREKVRAERREAKRRRKDPPRTASWYKSVLFVLVTKAREPLRLRHNPPNKQIAQIVAVLVRCSKRSCYSFRKGQ